MPPATPRPPRNTNDPAHAEADSDPGGVVLPFRRPSTRDRLWTVEDIDTEPMTAQHYDQAVTALAALIGQWKNRRDTSGSNEKAA
ncbi:hypothetical protein QRX60_48815 [Amycolatopsis mongoliensis]|uniref:Uncharacterized protein n=1 Tax=Amycolatopsis mongoliensis TaxID=715475 RepID=A0A9Y2JNM1_9PSEU|nr:hypothetical protein [Amycolatopsis sp. 4-36]WIY01828.1 hypothetical protein QRX60_48815 [Amycolatopsis sp. 4-36]